MTKLEELTGRIADAVAGEDEAEVVYACAAVIAYCLRRATPSEHERMIDSIVRYIRKWRLERPHAEL